MKKVVLALCIILTSVGCTKAELKELVITHGNISYDIETTKDLLVDILAENSISITKDDIVTVNDKEIEYNQLELLEVKNKAKIIIVIVTIDETSESKDIKFSTEIVEDSSIDYGVKKVSVHGKDGLETTVRKKIYHNGIFFEEVSEITIIEPITKVVLVGTKELPSNSSGSTDGGNSGGSSGSGGSGSASSGNSSSGDSSNGDSSSDCTITINGVQHPCD